MPPAVNLEPVAAEENIFQLPADGVEIPTIIDPTAAVETSLEQLSQEEVLPPSQQLEERKVDPEAVAAFVDKFLAPVDPIPEEGVLPVTGGAIPSLESGAAVSPGLS